MKLSFLQCVFCIGLTLFPWSSKAAPNLPEDKTKAVILTYYRIGEDHVLNENLTEDQFAEHVTEIMNGNYNVLPLPEIISSISLARALPENTIGITLEGGYSSAITAAQKHLIPNNIPFTVFVSADALNQKTAPFTNWKTLKALAKNKNVTLATLPASYTHLQGQTHTDLLKNLNRARQLFRENLGQEADYLAYPFGEYSLLYKSLAQSQGFKAAFGTHSGAVYSGADLYALPRFVMTERYGDLERFRLVTSALPLPVQDIEPANPQLDNESFFTGFTLPQALADQSDSLECFISGEDKPSIEKLGSRIEIRTASVPQDRTRLNCTMPGPVNEDDEIQWRWLGLLYHTDSKNPEQDELR